jgi:MFS family permease
VNPLLLALGAMFLQQTLVALGKALPAVIAPAIIADLRIDAAWIGVYFGLSATASLVAQLGCGSFIVRHGALRMSQISLAMMAAGTALAALGSPLMLVLSAIVCGAGELCPRRRARTC